MSKLLCCSLVQSITRFIWVNFESLFDKTYCHFLDLKGMKSGRAYNHLQSFAIRGNLGHLPVQSVDEISVALLEQSICLVQDKEATLSQGQLTSRNQVLHSPWSPHYYIHLENKNQFISETDDCQKETDVMNILNTFAILSNSKFYKNKAVVKMQACDSLLRK